MVLVRKLRKGFEEDEREGRRMRVRPVHLRCHHLHHHHQPMPSAYSVLKASEKGVEHFGLFACEPMSP